MSQIISVSDDVYASLKKIKGKQSFSQVLRRMIHQKDSKQRFMSFFGKGGIDEAKVREAREMWQTWEDKFV
ncbi:antitoxin VapB family protein [Candidatus Woesearchaeota archaeon]|nr:antitoxin VapB family protein [Candidatus Woesearchaeota archaeon]